MILVAIMTPRHNREKARGFRSGFLPQFRSRSRFGVCQNLLRPVHNTCARAPFLPVICSPLISPFAADGGAAEDPEPGARRDQMQGLQRPRHDGRRQNPQVGAQARAALPVTGHITHQDQSLSNLLDEFAYFVPLSPGVSPSGAYSKGNKPLVGRRRNFPANDMDR